jgi:hypothetical protein
MNTAAVTALQDQQTALLDALFTHPAHKDAHLASERLLAHFTTQGAQASRGLMAYQANGHALAKRSLAAAYPVIEQMLGHGNFAALARDLWHRHPPALGDLALWGEALPGFLARSEAGLDAAYLADVARVEWALHRAASAADAVADPASFARLGAEDPTAITLALVPGTALVSSVFPVASLVLSHRYAQPSLVQAAQRLHDGVAECALVWRQALQPQVAQVSPVEASLLRELLPGKNLAAALDIALATELADEQTFDFSIWLTRAVTTGLVIGVNDANSTSSKEPP